MSTFIGIDIGTYLVKFVQIEYKAKPYLIRSFLFPTPYTQSKKIDTQEFYNQIVSYIPIKTFVNSYIGINVPSSLVSVTVITLPKMSRKELEVAAIAEAKRKMLPAPGPNSKFEYSILGEVIIGKIPRYEVLIIKTDKECIEETLQLFDKFSLTHPPFISPNCYTILNIFPQNSPIYQKDTAFIDIGYSSIDITVAKGSNLRFFRNIKFGLREIITHLSSTLNISSQNTERIIKEKGILETNIDLSDRVKVAEEIMRQKYEASLEEVSQDKVNPLEFRLLWQTEVERIISEIRRTLVYYKELSEGSRVENIFFLGGGAVIKGLVPLLSKEIGGNCQVLEPFGETMISLDEVRYQQIKEETPLFASSASIALSTVLARKRKKVINFLPQELKRREIIIHRQIGFIVFSIFILCFTILGALNVLINNRILKYSIKDKDTVIARMGDILETLDKLKQERENIASKSGKVKELLQQRLVPTQILEDVVKRMPPEVFIVELFISKGGIEEEEGMMDGESEEIIEERSEEMTDEEGGETTGAQGFISQEDRYRIKIKAACLADYEESVKLAKIFKEKLERSPYLGNVELTPPKLEKITPVIGGLEVTLTQLKKREFSLEAELVASDEGF